MRYYSLNKSKMAQVFYDTSKISNEHDKELSIEKFADGEILPKFDQSIRGQEIFILVDGNTPDDMMKIFLTCDAAKRSGCKKINVILLYKNLPLEEELFKGILDAIGVKKIIINPIIDSKIVGFRTIDLTEDIDIANYYASLDKKFNKKGELFYSINKTPLANQIFDLLPYYQSTDDSLLINTTEEGTYIAQYTDNIKGKEIFILADGHQSIDLMKTFTTIYTARKAGAKKITAIFPYLPYSRQDKNDHLRSSIGAKLLADILQFVGIDQMITIELHAGSIQGFYNIPIIHLDGKLITSKYTISLQLEDVTFCAPDHGAIKRNKSYAKSIPGCTSDAVMDKSRKKPNEVASMTLGGGVDVVKNRNVYLPDDLGDTMGTICTASRVLTENGALSSRAILTHFLSTEPKGKKSGLQNIMESDLTELITTDTIPAAYDKVAQYLEMTKNIEKVCKITIVSCAKVLAKSIDRILKKESINELNTLDAV